MPNGTWCVAFIPRTDDDEFRLLIGKGSQSLDPIRGCRKPLPSTAPWSRPTPIAARMSHPWDRIYMAKGVQGVVIRTGKGKDVGPFAEQVAAGSAAQLGSSCGSL